MNRFDLQDAAIVDLRPAADFARQRPRGAVRLSADDVLQRPYLLPPLHRQIVLVGGSTPNGQRLVAAMQRAGRSARHLPDETWRGALETESGAPSRRHLWEASPLLVRTVERWSARLAGRTALDLACGSGRNAVYLALHGFAALGVDVLPEALARARDLAARSDTWIATLERDLARPGGLAGLRADLVVVVRYLERDLFGPIAGSIRRGGILVYETFTVDQQALGHPRNPRYLLAHDELRSAFPGLEVLEYEEGFFDGAHLGRLVARRS